MTVRHRLGWFGGAVLAFTLVVTPPLLAFRQVDVRDQRREQIAREQAVQNLRTLTLKETTRDICVSANKSAKALNDALDYFRNLIPPSDTHAQFVFKGVPRPSIVDCGMP